MTKKNRQQILLIEDDPSLAEVYELYLNDEPYQVVHVGTGKDALDAMRESPPEGIVLDLHLPDMNGLEILQYLQDQATQIPVVVITANGSIKTAVEAMRHGAADFVLKPFTADRLIFTLRHALERQQLERIVDTFKDDLDRNEYCGFVGSSLPMQAVYKTIDKAASSKATVFISGDSGTGKEVCAEAIHRKSQRTASPFIALNCAAIPNDLIESEMFGHVKGAFTGALAARDGAATLANGGTLFLDEICEMDPSLQVKLLRFLQTGTFQKVGSSKTESVDTRFVCATNRNPWEEVQAGRFREDLYYRLHVVPIHLPPLMERDMDVIKIAEHFLHQFSVEEGKGFKSISPEAIDMLSSFGWPGNVRQVQNVIRNIVVLNDGDEVTADMLPVESMTELSLSLSASRPEAAVPPMSVVTPMEEVKIKPMWRVEREKIKEAVQACDGNVPRAAALLELSPSTVYRRIRNIEDEDTGKTALVVG